MASGTRKTKRKDLLDMKQKCETSSVTRIFRVEWLNKSIFLYIESNQTCGCYQRSRKIVSGLSQGEPQ